MDQKRDDLPNPPFYWIEVEAVLTGDVKPYENDAEDVGPMPETSPGICPQCERNMEWLNWRNSDDCWEHECGSAGWLPVCRTCRRWGELIEMVIS